MKSIRNGWLIAIVFTLVSVFSATTYAVPQPSVVRHISGDVYEYVYTLTTGPGAYDRVGVHHVVRVEDGKPLVNHNAVFLVHGDAGNFNNHFLGGTSSPHSLAFYLASHGIDVWGIDLAWALVPQTVTDFTFMKDWGLQRQIDDMEKALGFARMVRRSMVSNGGQLVLLGFSRGGEIGYALLNQESQHPFAQRNVKAFIPMETFYKLNDPNAISDACTDVVFLNHLIASGQYADPFGQFFAYIAHLAVTDPNGASPPAVLAHLGITSPATNLQVVLITAAASYQVGINTDSPFFHFAAGTFGPSGIQGIPTGLRFTSISRAEEGGLAAAPFEPFKLEADSDSVSCGAVSTPFDTHLHAITVPVLYIGAAGGFGDSGSYTLTLLGSRDVQQNIVSFYPPDQKALDYGHLDLLSADNAEAAVWSKILKWLRNHGGDNQMD